MIKSSVYIIYLKKFFCYFWRGENGSKMAEKRRKNGGKDVSFFLNNCPFSEKCVLFFEKDILFFCFIKCVVEGLKRGKKKGSKSSKSSKSSVVYLGRSII